MSDLSIKYPLGTKIWVRWNSNSHFVPWNDYGRKIGGIVIATTPSLVYLKFSQNYPSCKLLNSVVYRQYPKDFFPSWQALGKCYYYFFTPDQLGPLGCQDCELR